MTLILITKCDYCSSKEVQENDGNDEIDPFEEDPNDENEECKDGKELKDKEENGAHVMEKDMDENNTFVKGNWEYEKLQKGNKMQRK